MSSALELLPQPNRDSIAPAFVCRKAKSFDTSQFRRVSFPSSFFQIKPPCPSLLPTLSIQPPPTSLIDFVFPYSPVRRRQAGFDLSTRGKTHPTRGAPHRPDVECRASQVLLPPVAPESTPVCRDERVPNAVEDRVERDPNAVQDRVCPRERAPDALEDRVCRYGRDFDALESG